MSLINQPRDAHQKSVRNRKYAKVEKVVAPIIGAPISDRPANRRTSRGCRSHAERPVKAGRQAAAKTISTRLQTASIPIEIQGWPPATSAGNCATTYPHRIQNHSRRGRISRTPIINPGMGQHTAIQ
jgi:hypothetical protein